LNESNLGVLSGIAFLSYFTFLLSFSEFPNRDAVDNKFIDIKHLVKTRTSASGKSLERPDRRIAVHI